VGRRMSRGKQQVLFNYLPGKTFDFEKIATIARVTRIRGTPTTDLNPVVLLRRVAENARAWAPDLRPGLRDEILNDPTRFVFLNPTEVQSEMFPKTLWCQNSTCGFVADFSNSNAIPTRCSRCRNGQLKQLRFVKIHRCGAIEPLLPPICPRCNNSRNMALDTRRSERFSNFLWVCRTCSSKATVFAGACRACQWPDPSLRNMDIDVHRAGRTYYAHTAVLLNIPNRQLDTLFSIQEWPFLVAAKFLELPEVTNRSLTDLSNQNPPGGAPNQASITNAELDDLMARQAAGTITPEQFVSEMQSLRQRKQANTNATIPSALQQAVLQRTGIAAGVWERSAQQLLESVLPDEMAQTRPLASLVKPQVESLAAQMGLSRVSLATEFPIINATYGFTRAEYSPQESRLNPFPPERQHAGRLPVFVDQVHADALLLRLDEGRVLRWMERNRVRPALPAGSDPAASSRAYFVNIFDNVPLFETFGANAAAVRMVFGLLHTISHICVRKAALLCGLEHTSISEYLLPKALSFAMYSNHRFGATIGALSALFEQSLADWLNAVRSANRCVYDPVCRDTVGSCHACTHVAETSCRFFNLNLNRSFLFGGPDPILGRIEAGYFDTSVG
jgi:hypothetical protein